MKGNEISINQMAAISIVSGAFIFLILYMGNFTNPVLAGILATVPFALPSIFFIKEKENYLPYSKSVTIGVVTYALIMLLFYYLITEKNKEKNNSIIFTWVVWGIVVFLIYYFYLSSNKIDLNKNI